MDNFSENTNERITCSVIIRTKDRPRHLRQALESVKNQSRQPDEVIVVNDGGEDVGSILDAFQDLFIESIINEGSVGRAKAGNMGAEAASGDAIAFLDDDDQFLPDHLARLTLAMTQFDAKVAYSGSRMIRKDLLGESATDLLTEQVVGEFNDAFDSNRLTFENYIPLNTLLMDRRLFLAVGGFDPDFNLFEDWDLLIRLSQKTGFYHVNRVTSIYGIWGDSQQITLLSKTDAWRDAYAKLFSKHFLPLPDGDKVDEMAAYWILSQQRRSQLQTLTENDRKNARERESLFIKLQQEEERGRISAQKEAAQTQQVQQQQEEIRQQQEKINALTQQIEQQKMRYENTCGRQMTALKSALKRQGERCQALQNAFFEQQRQIMVGLTTQGIAGITEMRKGIAAAPDQLKENYHRLAQWVNAYRDHVAEERDALFRSMEEISQAVAALERETDALLGQLNRSKLKPIWPGIPIPQVTALLGKSREIYKKISDHPRGVNSNVKEWSGQLTLLGERSPQGPSTPSCQTVAQHIPVFEIFCENSARGVERVAGTMPSESNPVPLICDMALSFTVRCSRDGWCRLDIMMATYMRINTCDIDLAIYHISYDDEHDQEAPLRHCRFNALEVIDNQYYTITFPPIFDSKGGVYRIELSSPNATEADAVAVMCHPINKTFLFPSGGRHGQFSHSSDGAGDIAQLPFALKQLFSQMDLFQSFEPKLKRADHLFWIYLPSQGDVTGTLPAILFQLAQMADAMNETASVIIYGPQNHGMMAYCEANQIEYRAMDRSRMRRGRLSWMLRQAAQSDAKGTHWFFDAGMCPGHGMMANANSFFKAYPDTPLLLPRVTSPEGKILHAFGQTTREGDISTFPVGIHATHPAFGYVREVDGATLPCFILRPSCLDSETLVSFLEAIGSYSTLRYQMTEFIWQLKAFGKTVRWDPSLSFTAMQIDKKRQSALHEDIQKDRHTFFEKWQSQLRDKPESYDGWERLLNPEENPTALVVDMALPAFDEDSGSLRMFELLNMMGAMGIKISFYPDNLDFKPKYKSALERLGIEVLSQDFGVAQALAERQYDMVILSRVNIAHRYINLVRFLNPDARVYYDTVDIHYIRELRQAEIEGCERLKRHAEKTRKMELSSCMLADVVFTVTAEDGRHLQQEIPSINAFVLPNIHRKRATDISWEKTDGLVFIGNYNHQPNQDAVFYFVEHVFPLIQARIPEIRLYLIGSYMPDAMKALSEKNHAIKAVGWVETVEPELMKRRVMVSYLRYGAGMKGKIGQAMSVGLPVVSTSIGAEGMGLVDGETVLVGDDPKTFAEKVCHAYTDKALWGTISHSANAFIYNHYGTDAVKDKLKTFLTTDLKWNEKRGDDA